MGNASEIAMIKFCQPFRDVDEYRAANPNLFKIPFNSKNKYQVKISENLMLTHNVLLFRLFFRSDTCKLPDAKNYEVYDIRERPCYFGPVF